MTRIYNLFYIFTMLIWGAFQPIVLQMDAMGRIVVLLTLIAIVLNLRNNDWKRTAFSKPSSLWLNWVIYAIINMSFTHHASEMPFVNTVLMEVVRPFMILTIVAKEIHKNSAILYVVLSAFFVYAALGLSSFSLVIDERSESILGNGLPNCLAMSVFVVCLLFVTNKIKNITWALLVIFALFVILFSGTRKAFGASVIIILFTLVARYNLYKAKHIVGLVLIGIVLYAGVNYVMDNTVMGERILDTADTADDAMAKLGANSNNLFLRAMGDRAAFYIIGWSVFLEHPIFGVGLKNFMNTTSYDFVIHSEYMVQLAECGIVGFILLVLFYWFIIKNNITMLRRSNDYDKKEAIVFLGGFLAIVFMNFYMWSYDACGVFTVYGIIIGTTDAYKRHFEVINSDDRYYT